MNVGKEKGSKVNLGLVLEIGDQCLSCIGQWSQYQHNVSVNSPRIYPDLWTQKRDLAHITHVTGNPAGGGLTLGLGEAHLQICSHQETISSALKEK